jgi:hypothetical protein
MVARSGSKQRGASLPKSQFFNLIRYIPKQVEESVFGGVSFPRSSDPHSRLASWAMVARSGSKQRGASLPKSQFFNLFRYRL